MRVILCVFWAIAALAAAWTAATWIHADERGLTWRLLCRRGGAAWPEIADYGLGFQPVRETRASHIFIQAGDRRIMLSSGIWLNAERLQTTVQRHAIRCGGKDWAPPGVRPGDSPRAFAYDRNRLLWLLRGQYAAMAWLGLVLALALSPAARRGMSPGELGVGLAGAGIFGAILAGPCLIMRAMVVATRDALSRVGETITVAPDRLHYQGAESNVDVAWSDIAALELVTRDGFGLAYRVRTAGGEFTFTRLLAGAGDLAAILAERATAFGGWRTLDAERGVEERADGSIVYRYRSPEARGLLWFPAGMVVVGLTIAMAGDPEAGRSANPGLVIAAASAIAYAVWLRSYRGVSFTADASGLTRVEPRRRTFIPWAEVVSYRTAGLEAIRYGIVEGGGRRIIFWHGPWNQCPFAEAVERRLSERKTAS